MLKPFGKKLLNASYSAQNLTSLALQDGQFLSRVFTDLSGQQFRLTFFVTIVAGQPRGHLFSAQPLKSGGRTSRLSLSGGCASSQNLCLPSATHKLLPHISYLISPALFISPYTELFFFTSQPTRAPNFAKASSGKPSCRS